MATTSTETLREQISDRFGAAVASDEKLVAECINMCQIFNLSPEDLFYKWEAVSYSVTRSFAVFDADAAKALKSQIQRDLERENQKREQARARASLNGMMVRGRGAGFLRLGQPAVRSAVGGQSAVRAPVQSTGIRDVKMEDAVAGPSRVRYEGPKNDPESKKRRAYRYMYEKISERSEALDVKIDHFAALVKERYDIAEFGDPASASEESTTVVGRILLDSESSSGKLNEASLSLESSRMMGSGVRVPLRFSSSLQIRGAPKGLGGAGLFPGAIVAVKGKNGGGGWFEVEEILSIPPPQPRAAPNKSESGEGSFSMVIASGPYTPDADLQYKPFKQLFSKLKSQKPDVVLLLGPFLDTSNHLLRDGTVDLTPAQLFKQIFVESGIRDFLDSSPGSIVLLVPSTKDLISDHMVFPQAELDEELTNGDTRIKLLPNPATFTLNGLTFGACSVDTIFHLRKEEFFKRAQGEVDPLPPSGEPNDAMGGLVRHLLAQRSFYPLFPVPQDLSHDVNLDVSHWDGLRLGNPDLTQQEEDYAPDVLITPSRLKHFAKVVDSTVAINPAYLTKGTYVSLTFDDSSSMTGQTSERIKAEVTKLES